MSVAPDLQGDVYSQYLITIADACSAAATGAFAVEVLLSSGQRVAGVPSAPRDAANEAEELDETGFANAISIDDAIVRLEQVVALTVLAPGVADPARR